MSRFWAKPGKVIPLLPLFHKERRDGFKNDLQVEPRRPVFDVVNIELDHLLERQAVAPADLRQAGQARFYVKPFAVPGLIAFDLIRNGRARADQRHLAFEDVEDLGQLVEAQAAQERAHAREPVAVDEFVTRVFPGAEARVALTFDHPRHVIAVRVVYFDVVEHRAELVDLEDVAVHPDGLLPVERRASRFQLDGDRDEQPERRGEEQDKRADYQVDAAFEEPRRGGKRLLEEAHHRDGAQLFDVGFARDAIQQIGHDSKRDARASPAFDHRVEEQLRADFRVGDQNLADAPLADEAVHLVVPAQRRPLLERLALRRFAVNRHEPDDRPAQLRVVRDLADTHLGDAVRPDDHHRDDVEMASAVRRLQAAEGRALGGEDDHTQQVIKNDDHTRIRELRIGEPAAVEERDHRHQQRPDRNRLEDVDEVIAEREFATNPVQAAIPEGADLDERREIEHAQVRVEARVKGVRQR